MAPFWDPGKEQAATRRVLQVVIILNLVLSVTTLWVVLASVYKGQDLGKAMADSQLVTQNKIDALSVALGDIKFGPDGKPVKTVVQHIDDTANDVRDNLADFTREGKDRIRENNQNTIDTKTTASNTKDAVDALEQELHKYTLDTARWFDSQSEKMDAVIKFAEQSKVASQATRAHAAIVQKRVLKALPSPAPKPWFHFP